MGLIVGGMAGVTAGAVGAAVMGLIVALLRMDQARQAFPEVAPDGLVTVIVVAAAFCGTLAGGIAGAAIGMAAGLMIPLVRSVSPAAVLRFCAGAHAVAGAILGWLLVAQLFGAGGDDDLRGVLLPWLGSFIGMIAAALSGAVVARSLLRVARLARRNDIDPRRTLVDT